jgi:hypothetical protein
MTRTTITFIATSLIVGVVSTARAQTCTLDQQNPIFNPGEQSPGTSSTWTFRTSTDNAVARVLIDSEGTIGGAAPDGYAELALRAQDEIRDPQNQVLASSETQASVRVMSRSFGYANDPTRGACRGTQCPDMLELLSSHDLRLTAAGGGTFDVVAGGTKEGEIGRRLIINKDGEIRMPDLLAAPKRRNFACFDETGKLVSQPKPCNQ